MSSVSTSWWSLDETSGTAAADIVDGNPGTHIDGPTPTPGVVAGGLSFDGVDDYVRIADAANLNPGTSDFSVDFWMRTSSQPTDFDGDNILSKRPICNVASFWDIRLGGANADGLIRVELREEGGANPNQYLSTIKVNDGQWRHIAVVREGPMSRLYIDGALDSSNTAEGTTNISNDADLLVGNGPCVGVDGTMFFDGELDEIEYFSVALTSAQVQAIYDAGSGGKCKPFSGDHQITGVLDAAGFQALISPGSIVSVFGDFVETTATASSIPLGTNLSGFSVTFNDIPGALFGVFDGDFDQSNVQVPWNVDVSSGKVEVKVHWKDDAGEVWSDPFEVDAALASPGIYMFPPGTTQAIVTNFKPAGDNDVIAGSWAQPSGSVDPVEGQPAAIGGVVTLWCDGLGPVSPEPATGDIPPPGTVPLTDKIVRVFVGGVEAQVLAAVLQPTSVGLNQINIVVPAGVTPGDAVPIVIEVECPDGTKIRSREDVTIAVRAAP